MGDAAQWDEAAFELLGELSATTFHGLVGERVVLTDEGDVELVVVAVHRYGEDERPFDVVLAGPEDLVLPQAIHAVAIPGTGTVPVFLVPAGPSEHGQSFVASFG